MSEFVTIESRPHLVREWKALVTLPLDCVGAWVGDHVKGMEHLFGPCDVVRIDAEAGSEWVLTFHWTGGDVMYRLRALP